MGIVMKLKNIICFFALLVSSSLHAQNGQAFNPFYANQTARDAMEHGSFFYVHQDGSYDYATSRTNWSSFPSFGFDPRSTSRPHDLISVFLASEFVSNHVGRALLLNPNGNMQIGPVSGVIYSYPTLRDLTIARERFVLVRSEFRQVGDAFFQSDDFKSNMKFSEDISALRNKVLRVILDSDFSLSEPVLTVQRTEALLPLLFFINKASDLDARLFRYHNEAQEMPASVEVEKNALYDEYLKIIDKLEKGGELSQLIHGLFDELNQRYVQLSDRLDQSRAKVDNKLLLEHLNQFENAYYEGFALAVEKFHLTVKQQQLLLQAFSEVDAGGEWTSKSEVLSCNGHNRSRWNMEKLTQHVGYRFLATILNRRFNYKVDGIEASHKLQERMKIINRALVLQIGASRGEKWYHRMADRAKAAEHGQKNPEALERALEVIRRVSKR